MQVVIQPAAAADLEQAFSWYEERRPGLGAEFLAEIRSAIKQIETHPESSPVVHRDIRRLMLRRFPYGLFYRIYDEMVVVIGCMHARRHSSRWKNR